MNEIVISTDSPFKEFNEHISFKGNSRILFSGPFGIGKTTFINRYFSEKNNEYFPIFLRPVNYIVASNEDIFKLIKHDILFHLLEKDLIEVEDFGEFTNLEIVQNFLSGAKLELFTPLIASTGEIGAKTTVVMLALDRLRSKFVTNKKRINENQDVKVINAFLKNNQEHFLLENDFITQLIKGCVSRINSRENFNGAVLIIDDLDRIDPEHIFRLFNVFSAHFDYTNELENKFDLHRIIFVCDINNIRSIFQNKYGISTDFNGYIDKFYSTKIFNYNNRKAILEFITINIPYNELIAPLSSVDIKFLIDILCEIMNYQLINLRNLKKITLKKQGYNHIINIDFLQQIRLKYFSFPYILLILVYLIGDMEALISILDKCLVYSSKGKTFELNSSKENHYFKKYLLPILEFNKGTFVEDTQMTYRYNGLTYNFVLKSDTNNMIYAESTSDYSFPGGTFWKWMIEATEVLKHEIPTGL